MPYNIKRLTIEQEYKTMASSNGNSTNTDKHSYQWLFKTEGGVRHWAPGKITKHGTVGRLQDKDSDGTVQPEQNES